MQIIAVMGYLCSGKTTYANQYSDAFVKVEISDIVRKITSSVKRVHNPNLDIDIIGELHTRIMNAADSGYAGVVVTGIRQISILQYLESMCETMDELKLHRVWLEVPTSILEQRFKERADFKDREQTYEEVVERDNKLGVAALVEYLKIVNTHTIKNYNNNETVKRNAA